MMLWPSVSRQNMAKPPPDVFELPLLERAALAVKAAMEEVIEEPAQWGLPLYICRDGKVVAVSAEELRKKS